MTALLPTRGLLLKEMASPRPIVLIVTSVFPNWFVFMSEPRPRYPQTFLFPL